MLISATFIRIFIICTKYGTIYKLKYEIISKEKLT